MTTDTNIMSKQEIIILNKIKAEIKELFKEPAYYIPNYDAYKKVLKIIDRYSAENERNK